MSQFMDMIRLPNFGLGVAKGQFQDITSIHKFGANFDIDNNSEPETVWSAGGLYPWSAFATAQTLYCLSDDESDTEEVTIQGLDADYNLLFENVTLNGTTPVTTTNEFMRVFGMSYEGAAENAGTITARVTSGSGTIVAQIDGEFGQTLMCVYTIPAGHTGYLLCGDASVQKSKDAQIKFFVREFGKSFKIAHMAEVFEVTYRYDFPVPMRIPEKTDLEVRADNVETNNTRVTANFDLILDKD
jgi:hypothetical protein